VRVLVTLLVTVFATACGASGKTCTCPALADASRIEVRTNLNEPLATVTTSEEIARARAFVDSHPSGWYQPWAGTPVPPVVLYFYRDETLLGGFGVGDNFIVAAGGFCSWYVVDVDPQVTTAFLRTLRLSGTRH
jgi:hypothetical protein